MDFAPYQDANPEQERALSPPPPPRRSLSRSPAPPKSPPPRSSNLADPFSAAPLPAPSHFANEHASSGFGANGNGNGGGAGGDDVEGGRRGHVDLFATSLPMRMDHEAMLAYLLLPPAGGVLLLVLEHKSDYVRFHAWQSSLLFAAIFVIHLIFSFSGILSWILFALDVVAIGFLTLRAYRDADTLDRFEVPFFGRLASSFVDDE